MQARNYLDLLGVDGSRKVCVFYDDSPSDKIFTLSSDFKKANDDRLLGEMRSEIIFSIIIASILFKQLVDIYKLLKVNDKKELVGNLKDRKKGISKIKRKNKKK